MSIRLCPSALKQEKIKWADKTTLEKAIFMCETRAKDAAPDEPPVVDIPIIAPETGNTYFSDTAAELEAEVPPRARLGRYHEVGEKRQQDDVANLYVDHHRGRRGCRRKGPADHHRWSRVCEGDHRQEGEPAVGLHPIPPGSHLDAARRQV